MAIDCKTLQDVTLSDACGYSTVGVAYAYITAFQPGITRTYDTTNTNLVTQVTLPTGSTWSRIELPLGVGQGLDELQISGALRAKLHTINFGLSKVDATLGDFIDNLNLGKWIVLLDTGDENLYGYGFSAGMMATTQTDDTGISDAAGGIGTAGGYTVTLAGVQKESKCYVARSVVETED